MDITTINAQLLSKMFLNGARCLDAKKDLINELNVFPVPDGDTGTNMSMTIMSASDAVKALSNPQMADVCKAMSSGSLRGARGNSGVILSQLFRGFCKVIKTYDELDVAILCEASQKAVETAYKAVMKPKEGTILTVAKGAADKALELVDETEDITYFVGEVLKEAEYVLSQTPEMLPVLKQAGVVDSGGQGLVEVLRGAYNVLIGKEEVEEEEAPEVSRAYALSFTLTADKAISPREEIEFKNYVESIGSNLSISTENQTLVLSADVDEPGQVLSKALTMGSLSKVLLLNKDLKETGSESAKTGAAASDKPVEEAKPIEAPKAPAMPHKDMAFISVSIGEGLGDIFRGLGVDYIIEGGQTMNPSTDDILKAVEQVNADHIFVLPNNKNIIMAANQAVSLVEDKDLIVIPTKTIPQGIAALVNFIPDFTAEDNTKAMTEAIEAVKTGQVTYAVRDTEIDGKEIHQGDYMGIGDKTILAVGTNLKATTLSMLDEMIDEESAIISIYYGSESNEEDANELASILQDKYPDLEVEVNNGGQPIYYYMISVE